MATPNDLFALQKTDTALFTLRAKLHEIQRDLQEPDDLVSTKAVIQKLTEALATTGAKVKDSELQVGTLQDKLNRSTEHLYSGKIKNPKELEDLESEVKSLTGRVETVELELMEHIETQENLKSDLETNQIMLQELEEDWDGKSSELRTEQQRVALEMKQIIEKRKPQADKIDASILANYVKLLKSKSGVGISKLSGSQCEGCKISMDGGTVRQVNSNKWVNCPNCGRYLIRG